MAFAEQNKRERAVSAAAVLFCHVLIFYFFITGLKLQFTPPQSDVLAVFNTRSPPPPPPVEEVVPPKPATKAPGGGGSPPNLKAVATPIVAPKPQLPTEAPSTSVTAEKPDQGAAPFAGAAAIAGPGTGSGGTGTGSGGGSGSGTGSGSGSGAGGAPVRRARLVAGSLSLADYPPALRRAGIGGRVDVHLTVEPNGRVSRCLVAGSSGSAELDATTCRLIRQRYLYDPARDAQGRPVRDLVGEPHLWRSGRRGR